MYSAFINLVSPSALDSFSQNETLALVNSLSTSNKTLTEAQIEALAGNLPDNYSEPLNNTVALASALPLTSFDSTSPRDLVTLIQNGKLQLSLLDDTRKIYIATTVFIDILKNAFLFKVYFFYKKIKIASSNDSVIIRDLLLATSDNIIINAIPASLFSNLKINTTGIPATNIPTAHVNILFLKCLLIIIIQIFSSYNH
jgi:hypothetical protein